MESATDTIPLNDLLNLPTGVQALAGATGLGLAPVTPQWIEGAGDGATYRGRRTNVRDIDVPLLIDGGDRAGLKAMVSRIARMCAGPFTLRFVEDSGESWTLGVVRVGGGDYVYGSDTTGDRDLQMVLTLRAGDPYWTSATASQRRYRLGESTAGLLPYLSRLQLSPDSLNGVVEVENTGDAETMPTWIVRGPGSRFEAKLPGQRGFAWSGTLAEGESLVFDTRAGTVVDQTGASRYSGLEPAPLFWALPPGVTTAEMTLSGAGPTSEVVCTWRRRKWAVV